MSKKAKTKAAPEKAPAKAAKPASRKVRVSSTETATLTQEAADRITQARLTA